MESVGRATIAGDVARPAMDGGGGREAVFAGVGCCSCRVGVERIALRAGEGGEIGVGEGAPDEVDEFEEMGVGMEDTEEAEEVGEIF